MKSIRNKTQLGSVHVIIVSVLVIALLGATAFLYWKNFMSAKSEVKNPVRTQTETAKTKTSDPYAGWAVCEDKGTGLLFRYPSNWELIVSKNNPCNSIHPEAGENFVTIISPKRTDSKYIWRVQFFDEVRKDIARPNSKQIVQSVDQLEIPSSKDQLFIISSSSESDSGKVGGFGLTDTRYSIGQTIESTPSVLKFDNERNNTYQLSASLAEARNQQYVDVYPLSVFQTHPDYGDLVKIFQSLKFQ